MKIKNYTVIGVCFILLAAVAVSFAAAGPVITEEDSKRQIEREGGDINRALNQSAQGGKLAGEVEMEQPFVDNFSGGLPQEIDDTVRSQNELQDKDY